MKYYSEIRIQQTETETHSDRFLMHFYLLLGICCYKLLLAFRFLWPAKPKSGWRWICTEKKY